MAEQQLADDLVRRLAASYRVVTLGGVAVITHGLRRNTHDLDVWLDPMESPDLWCSAVQSALAESPGLTVTDMGSFSPDDIQFLEGKAEEMHLKRLPQARADEASEMLSRFLNPRVADAAARHADPQVRETGLKFLRELAAEGDPFARDLLKAFL